MSWTIKLYKLHIQNIILLYDNQRIYNDSVYIIFINWIKWEKNKQWCTFFIHHYVDVELKKKTVEFYVEKLNLPSCSEQSDSNAPDVVITTCQHVNMNLPGGLECIISCS